jgi:hypothetical protein
LSVRQFARHLGVSDRVISAWEAGGAAVRPRPGNQAILDESLRRCTPVERGRFDAALAGMPRDSRPPVAPMRWALIVDLPAADAELAATIASAVRAGSCWPQPTSGSRPAAKPVAAYTDAGVTGARCAPRLGCSRLCDGADVALMLHAPHGRALATVGP